MKYKYLNKVPSPLLAIKPKNGRFHHHFWQLDQYLTFFQSGPLCQKQAALAGFVNISMK